MHEMSGQMKKLLDRTHLKEAIFAGDVREAGDIRGHESLVKAYEAGRNV